MSHYTVMVIGKDPEKQLAPYQEGGTFFKTDGGTEAKWDWYQLGGRWTGFLKLKPGTSGKKGEPGLMTEGCEEGYADAARKCDIDVEGMRAEAGEKARKRWRQFHRIVDGLSPIKYWRDVLEAHGKDVGAAREEYSNQPAVQAFRGHPDFAWMDDDELRELYRPEADFVAAAQNRALQTFAVLKEGEWFERGSMGWFGHVADEKDPMDWSREFAKLIDGLPEDTLISIYDCHI